MIDRPVIQYTFRSYPIEFVLVLKMKRVFLNILLAFKMITPGRNANNKMIFIEQIYYIRNNN